MAKTIDRIKADLIGEVVSMTDLENYMAEYKFHLVENDGEGNNTIKFTNYSSQIWINIESDNEGDILINKVKYIARINSEATKVDPFHSYEDLEKVQNYFKDNEMLHHWLAGWLMVAEGRRIGDTMKLKWSDFFRVDGKYRKRLTQLKEEKTGKVVAPAINAIAQKVIDEYIETENIQIKSVYNMEIFSCGSAAFRKALKKAVEESGIDYPVSCHSYRKYYANSLYKLHPQDTDNLKIVQFQLGHSSEEITKGYIGEIDRKIDQYNKDYADYILAKQNGLDVEISNSPIIPLKAEEFRELLSRVWDMGHDGREKFESINEVIGMAEQSMV